MARVIVTAAFALPTAGATGRETAIIPRGAALEVTPSMAAAITSAGGTTRAVTAMTGTAAHDQLGEAVGVSNSSA